MMEDQTPQELAAIKWARENLATDEVEIDAEPKTSESDEGTWVAAWVWVPLDRD